MKIYIFNERLEGQYGQLISESKKAFSKRNYAVRYMNYWMGKTADRFDGGDPYHPENNEEAWKLLYETEDGLASATVWIDEVELDANIPELKTRWEWNPKCYLDTIEYSFNYLGMSDDEQKLHVKPVHKSYEEVEQAIIAEIESALYDWESWGEEYDARVWYDEVRPTIDTYANFAIMGGFNLPESIYNRVAAIEEEL